MTRQAADPCNRKPQASKLKVRKKVYSQRVVADWNRIPSELKMAKIVELFRKGYGKHRSEWVT